MLPRFRSIRFMSILGDLTLLGEGSVFLSKKTQKVLGKVVLSSRAERSDTAEFLQKIKRSAPKKSGTGLQKIMENLKGQLSE